MSDRLRDIRELAGDTDAYRDELYRRWTGLLSYRYIGRKHSSMNLGETDDTVTIRRDMRNEAGGIMVAPLAISSPEGCQTDMVAVPNPVIASVQIIDPGYDVKRVEIVGSGIVHQGRTMGYGRCTIVDADNPGRVIAFNEGQGAIIGVPPEGLDRMDVSGTELVIEDSDELPPLWRAFGASRRGDVPQIGEDLRLCGEAFGPLPAALQLFVERIGVVHTFDVATRTRVAVPVPGAADVRGRLERGHRQAG